MRASWIQAVVGILCVGTVDALAIRNPLPAQTSCDVNCHSISVLEPRFFNDSTFSPQRLKVKYGPFTVPPSTQDNGKDTFYLQTAPPCTNCLLTHIQPGLEHPDGAQANADTNLQLHHVRVTNVERDSVTCALLPEPVFAAGNERAAANICLDGTRQAGYPLSKTAGLNFVVELINTSPSAQDAVVTVEWEFVPSSAAAGFQRVTPVWLDIDGGCPQHESQVPVPDTQSQAGFNMDPPWTAGFGGEVLWVTSHLQDGGEELTVMRNGAMACKTVAGYGEGKEAHLVSISACEGAGRVEIGENWGVKAGYDFTKHAPVMEGGRMAPVMGVALMYVARDGE